MSLEFLEANRHWRATAAYHGSRGERIVYLMDDGLIGGGYYWLIADSARQWPMALRHCDFAAAARMIAIGKILLTKGQWPQTILKLLAPSASASLS